MRKENWKSLMNNEEYEEITSFIKDMVLKEHLNKIKRPMVEE